MNNSRVNQTGGTNHAPPSHQFANGGQHMNDTQQMQSYVDCKLDAAINRYMQQQCPTPDHNATQMDPALMNTFQRFAQDVRICAQCQTTARQQPGF